MSMNDDPRGFRRGPASREYAQQRGQTQQPRDRFDQYSQQSEQRSSQLPPERPQASFSAYKPEAYATNANSSQSSANPANDEWDRKPPQRPAPQPHANMAPPPLPRPEPPASDPYSMPSDLPNDPFYQPAASDPYATQSPRGFDKNWDNDDFGSASGQFQDFYPQDEHPGFEGDPQTVHDEFFSGADQGMDDILPPPIPGNNRNLPPFDDRALNAGGMDDRDFDAAGGMGDFDFGHDDAFGAPQQPPPQQFGAPNDGFGAGPPQRNRRQQARAPQNFDDPDFYDWDEFEQPPAPEQQAARPFHPPAVRDEDLDTDFFADEDDFDIDEYETGGGKKKLLAAVLAGAVVVGGGGAYLYNSGKGNISAGNPPAVISANSTPVKEAPAEPGGRDFPNGSKLIYDRLGDDGQVSPQGSAAGGNDSEQLASVPGLVTTSGGTLEERIENALRAQGGEGQGAAEPSPADTPRTVQTLTFGPDGSQQPTEQANNGGAGNPLSGDVVVSSQPSSSPGYGTEQPPSQTSSVTAAQPQQETQQLAAIDPQQNQAAPVPANGGAYFVQIGARNDPQAATEAFKALQKRYASVIGNYSPSLRKADLGSKGVWYRLWVGPVNTKGDAEALCEQLKLAGMKACLIRKDQ